MRVLQMEDCRVPKQAYKMISMEEKEQKCWVTEVKNVLSKNDFDCVQLQKRVGDEKRFLSELKQRRLDNFIQERNAAIRNKDRYFPRRSVKSIFGYEQYFSVLEIYCFRVGLSQLRHGVLPVNNNLRLYSVFGRNRNCVLCENVVKDEEYFLFTCPLYADIRVKLLNDASQNATIASLLNVLAWKNKTNLIRLAKFVFSARRRREEFTGSSQLYCF